MTTEEPRPEIRILAGNATDDEIAAVTAVLTAALDELAGESRREGASGRTAWQLAQRNVRAPLQHGAWRNFGG